MVKTVTFAFNSSTFKGTEAKETFTIEELRIDNQLDKRALEEEMERIFRAWIWEKLNISYSIVMEESIEKEIK